MLIRNIFYRFIQKILYLSMFILPFREPFIYHHIEDSAQILLKHKKNKVLIVTDKIISKQLFFNRLIESLKNNHLTYVIFDETKPNPSIQQIEKIYLLYKNTSSDSLIAIGGGSVIDAAKGVGIKVTHSKIPLKKMKGILKVIWKQPLLIAIPTTAGTGSEATVACVVTDETTHEKYAINDPIIIPKYAILDELTIIGLPASITATTGMDALTHSIEAWIGKSNTRKTKRMALSSIKLIQENLYETYIHPKNHLARKRMLLASYQAGVAFTRAYVGNVHALAHQLGGMYNTPHGLANAVVLPKVLERYGKSITKKLAFLSDLLKLLSTSAPNEDKRIAFIDWVKSLNTSMSIPNQLEYLYTNEEIQIMAKRAFKESNPLYPVPVIFNKNDFIELYHQILKSD